MRPVALGLVVLAACSKDRAERAPTPQPAITDAPPVVPGALRITGFASPESVVHDTAGDVYLVSNVNGGAHDADDNGYISKVSPDGEILQAKWIDGARPEITLDGPKGMAISGDLLWVTDITHLRAFELATGTQVRDIRLPGVTFLNDLVPDGAGGVYMSETGLDKKFEPTGTDALFHVDKDGAVTTLAKDKSLAQPNGLLWRDGTLWVLSFDHGGEISKLSGTQRAPIAKLPKGQLDGIAATDDAIYVSSWDAKAVYQGDARGAAWKELVTNVQAPADIGVDEKRRRLLVPKIMDGELLIVPLP